MSSISIMAHLNDMNAVLARDERKLPAGLLTRPDNLRLCSLHIDQLATLFEILCDSSAYQDRLEALDEFLNTALRQQALAEAHNLGELGTRSRETLIAILHRWRADIAPLPQADSFTNGPDPVEHNPAHTNLAPEDCAA